MYIMLLLAALCISVSVSVVTVCVFVCVVFQLSKSNSQYHKIFKEISKEEQLRQSKSICITTPRSSLNTE